MDNEIEHEISKACKIIADGFTEKKIKLDHGVHACLEMACMQLLFRGVSKNQITELVNCLCNEIEEKIKDRESE